MRKEQAFKRNELKFLVDMKQQYELLNRLKAFTVPDGNCGGEDYNITSLYYDTDDFKFYFEKVDGESYRKKLRIRGYNDIMSGDSVFVEIKYRMNQMTSKYRVRLPLEKAYSLLDNNNAGSVASDVENIEEMDEILHLKGMYKLVPKLIVRYNRKAYTGLYESDLRITFDTNLRCRAYELKLEHKGRDIYVISPQYCIMEVKINDRVPIWLNSMLNNFNITIVKASKYCMGVERLKLV